MMPTNSTLFSFCEEIPMHHQCMHPVEEGGKKTSAHGHVCGRLICAPCSIALGNAEGMFCCMNHSRSPDSKSDSEADKGSKSYHITPTIVPSRKKAKVMSKSVKGSEYTAKDLLVLSQAYIRASENAIDGVSQKRGKFWDDVAEAFKSLKAQ